MSMDPEQVVREREGVVGSAKAWLGTPYHHMGEIRGVGADCVTVLRCSFIDARINIIPVALEHYPADWHLHRDAERYMEGLLGYCTEMPPLDERRPEPADILLFRFGRTFSHGALVLDFPDLLHSVVGQGVVRTNLNTDTRLTTMGAQEPDAPSNRTRPIKVFSLTCWVK